MEARDCRLRQSVCPKNLLLGTGRPSCRTPQFDKITTRETIYEYIRKFPIRVHRGRGQNFPIFISCRYLVELGLPVADFGKIQTGAHKRGLQPQIFGENRAKTLPRKSGLFGPFSGPIGAFSGPIGTDSSAPHSRGEAEEIGPKGPFWAQLAPFGLSPRLLSPRLDFPNSFEASF